MTQLHGRPGLKGLGIKLSNTQKFATYLGFIIVSISGVWWSFLHDLLSSTAFDLMHNLLVIHGVSAALALMLFGALMPQHIRLAWHAKRNRISGGLMSIIMLIIILTGLGLYYAGEDYREPIKWTHLMVGIMSITALIMHIWLGRRSNKPHVYFAKSAEN